MDVHVSRASAVVVQRVPPAAAEWFMEWQRGITAAAEGFAGYRGTDVYPPADGQRDEWVVVLHYDDEKSLRQWLDSPARAQWVDKLRSKVGDFQLQALPGGFGPWFAGLVREPGPRPPSWKMALTVLLALYPTVMILTIITEPIASWTGPAVVTLLSNVMSVSILQWVMVPLLTLLLGRWLKANRREDWPLSFGGVGVIVLVLATLALAFRPFTG